VNPQANAGIVKDDALEIAQNGLVEIWLDKTNPGIVSGTAFAFTVIASAMPESTLRASALCFCARSIVIQMTPGARSSTTMSLFFCTLSYLLD
jgi:hypothetical protein